MQKLLLTHTRAPGDIVTMTALVRDLQLAYPGQYAIEVHTPCKDLWQHNPYLTKHTDHHGLRTVRLDYGTELRRGGRECLHFLRAWHNNFQAQTGVFVPLLYPYPDLHLTEAERRARLIPERYWVLVAGGKLDFTTKHWVYGRHQEVVHLLNGYGLRVVQAGALDKGPPAHYQPKLTDVIDLVGQTSLREFMRLIAQADGVICTITLAMHLAAALGRPCVVTGGGREGWWWEAYHRDNPGFGPHLRGAVTVNHRYLHTLGQLDCCQTNGCWKSKVLASEQKDPKQANHCRYPVQVETGQTVPRCMQMIEVRHVVEAVLSYYLDGTLPPVRREAASPAQEAPHDYLAHQPWHPADWRPHPLQHQRRTALVLTS